MPGRNHSRYGRNASWAKLVMGETRGYHFMPYLVKSKFHVFNLSLIVWLPREGIHTGTLHYSKLYLTLAETTSEKPQYLMQQI